MRISFGVAGLVAPWVRWTMSLAYDVKPLQGMVRKMVFRYQAWVVYRSPILEASNYESLSAHLTLRFAARDEQPTHELSLRERRYLQWN